MAQFAFRAATDPGTAVGVGGGVGNSIWSLPHRAGVAARLQQAETAYEGSNTAHQAGIAIGGSTGLRRTDRATARRGRLRMHDRSRRAARPDARGLERIHRARPGRPEPGAVGAGSLIQITPQIRILVAVESID